MAAVVLESSLGSQYEDSPSAYEFPSQYLGQFPAPWIDPVYAVLYEPRGDDGRGRMKYVAWAQISGPPTPSGRTTAAGRPLYLVHYTAPAVAFDNPVPREIFGEPVETWLAGRPRGRARNVATFGRAIRTLIDGDFQRILTLGGAAILEATPYPIGEDHATPLTVVRERSEILVSILRRNAQFRRVVISAYEERCAVSGFGLGQIPLSKATGLLDAAHIRPVAHDGPDALSNGLPLTPTLHRLFDAGLFTVAYAGGVPEVRVSPRLEQSMITSPDKSFRLELRNGLQLALPRETSSRPNRDQLRFHQRRVFQGDAAGLGS